MYQSNSLKMRCATHTKTFGDVIKIAKEQFGLEKEIVFIADKPNKGVIFMNEQNVFEQIFPFKSAKRITYHPKLYVVLSRRMNELDIVNNQQDLKLEGKKQEGEYQKSIEVKNRLEQEKEEERLRQAAHQTVIDQYRKKRRMKEFISGLCNFLIVLLLSVIMYLSSNQFFNNRQSFSMKQSIQDQILN